MPTAAATEAGKDVAAVEQACFELLHQSIAAQCKAALKRRLGDGCSEEALAAYTVQRSLAEGFYFWAAHLFMIDAALTAGISLRSDQIQRDEAQGLAALRRARSRFAAQHPDCPHCGTPLFDRGPSCVVCGGERG